LTRETVTHYIDDLDGSMGDVQTVSFTIDKVQYQVELSAENRAKFHEALAPYVKVARRFRGNPGRRGKLPYGSARQIREWALEQGLLEPGKSTGRLPEKLIRDYLDAQKAAQGS
jgi:hypothetical protein